MKKRRVKADPRKLAIEAYFKDLVELSKERSAIDRRRAGVEKAARAAIDLLEGDAEYESYLERFDEVVRPAGLTAAISAFVVAAGSAGISPIQARDSVRSLLLGHSNPIASVHTILKRLVKTGDFERTTRDDQTVYRSVDRQKKNNSEFQAYIAELAHGDKK